MDQGYSNLPITMKKAGIRMSDEKKDAPTPEEVFGDTHEQSDSVEESAEVDTSELFEDESEENEDSVEVTETDETVIGEISGVDAIENRNQEMETEKVQLFTHDVPQIPNEAVDLSGNVDKVMARLREEKAKREEEEDK